MSIKFSKDLCDQFEILLNQHFPVTAQSPDDKRTERVNEALLAISSLLATFLSNEIEQSHWDYVLAHTMYNIALHIHEAPEGVTIQ